MIEQYEKDRGLFWKRAAMGVLYAIFAVGVTVETNAQDKMDLYSEARLQELDLEKSNSELLRQQVTLQYEQVSIEKLLTYLEQKKNIQFSYDKELLAGNPRVTVDLEEVSLGEALDTIFKNTAIQFYAFDGGYIVLRESSFNKVVAQAEAITGMVTDAQSAETLPGVNVMIKGTTTGTSTDGEGSYELNVPSLQDTLIFSFVGYQTQEVPINGRTEIDVALQFQAIAGDEVVVVGYGTQQRSDLTGSISSVDNEQINSFPSTNIMQSLAGRSSGVKVSQSSGAPGAGVSIRIRGTNSIQGGNEPLYVVDGFPLSGAPTNINNSDIESVEILKDASATAIYGSRGANGVIIVTTKEGQRGGAQVDFETSYSIQSIRRKLDLMNAREYAILHNTQAENDGLEPYFSQEEINNFQEGFNWQDFIFQEAPMLNSSLNIRGGSDKTQYSIGGSVLSQEGIIPNSDYNRYSLRTKVNHDISDKLSFNLSGTLTHLKTERKDHGGGQRGNSLINIAISAPPLSTPYDDEGNYTVLANEYPFVAVDLRNPLNYIHELSTETKANVVLANAALVYNPIPELTIKFSGGIESRNDRTDSYRTRNFINSNGNASINTGQERVLLNENTIEYSNTFREKHEFTALAGFTYQQFLNTTLGGSGTDFLSDVFETHDLGAAETPGIPSSSYSKAVILSSLARINYSFDDRFLVTASFRTDGSSRYSEGDKWGYFPSGAFAWRISEEDFIQNNEIISDLKLRTSWGLTGSQAIGAYATQNQLSSGKTVFGNELYPLFGPSTRLPNDLKWETTEQIDIGLDLGLLDNRFFISTDYYIKNTFDLLNTVSLPSSMGYTHTIRNIGEVQNKGFELHIDGSLIRSSQIGWDISTNISFNRNKVMSLHNGEDILRGAVNVLVMSDDISILREGRPIGQFWGYVSDGFNEQGQFNYKDLNGDDQITDEDKTYIGNPNPDFTFGFNSSTRYKNFELSVFLQGDYGGDIFNLSSVASTLDYGQGLNMPREVFTDHWTPENPNAKYPIISRNSSTEVSNRWVEDGSYIRLKNIKLAYNVPAIEKIGLDNAQLYLSGQNLITLTKYSWWDPELNSGTNGIDHFSYPPSRIITAGIRAQF